MKGGGSIGFADPQADIGFGYLMNNMQMVGPLHGNGTSRVGHSSRRRKFEALTVTRLNTCPAPCVNLFRAHQFRVPALPGYPLNRTAAMIGRG